MLTVPLASFLGVFLGVFLGDFLGVFLGVFLSASFRVLLRIPPGVLILLLIYVGTSIYPCSVQHYRQTHLHPAPHRP